MGVNPTLPVGYVRFWDAQDVRPFDPRPYETIAATLRVPCITGQHSGVRVIGATSTARAAGRRVPVRRPPDPLRSNGPPPVRRGPPPDRH